MKTLFSENFDICVNIEWSIVEDRPLLPVVTESGRKSSCMNTSHAAVQST